MYCSNTSWTFPVSCFHSLAFLILSLCLFCKRAWVNLIPELERWENSVACIGETTASAAKRLGLTNVYYPTDPGLYGYDFLPGQSCVSQDATFHFCQWKLMCSQFHCQVAMVTSSMVVCRWIDSILEALKVHEQVQQRV